MRWQECKDPGDGNVTQYQSPQDHRTVTIYVSYAAGEGDVIYRRTWDQKTGKKTYERRFLADGEAFEPWQTEPR